MNDEEKQAIEYYENNEYSFGFETDFDTENFKKAIGIEETDEDTFERHQIRFKTLLNLIEKQQRELEDLKATTRAYEAYECEEDNKIVIASKEYFINGFFKNFLNDYISKDKIKEKIEELKEYIYETEKKTCGRCITIGEDKAIQILRELLGE